MVYPDWRSAQARAVEDVCSAAENDVWVAVADDDRPIGFVAVGGVEEGEAHAAEIHMLAVHPDDQGLGIGSALLERAVAELQAAVFDLAVIGTGGDPGHAPARALYEKHGSEPFPLARYYRRL